jgi:hypothetical protein
MVQPWQFFFLSLVESDLCAGPDFSPRPFLIHTSKTSQSNIAESTMANHWGGFVELRGGPEAQIGFKKLHLGTPVRIESVNEYYEKNRPASVPAQRSELSR